MSSFKRSKKGVFTIVPEFLVKLIFAIAASLLVIFLLYAIWHMIFSSDDKVVMKSFQTFHSVLDSKSQSTKDYDSSYITLYTGNDYYVCLFSKDPKSRCATFTKPDACTSSKACLCLYDGNDNNDVKKCLDLDGNFEIGAYQMYTVDVSQYVNFQGMYVGGGNTQLEKNKFNSLIVAVQNIVGNPSKRILYVWRENDMNVALDKELSKPLCPNNDNICFKQKQDELLQGKDVYGKVLDECRLQKKNTPLAKCSFSNNRCDLSCLDADMKCNDTITTCMNYSRYSDDGTFSNSFIVSDSPAEWMCINNVKACKLAATCGLSDTQAYICNKADNIDNCNTFIGTDGLRCNLWIYGYTQDNFPIIGFFETIKLPEGDSTVNSECTTIIKKYFDKIEPLACKYSLNCNEFINEISKDAYKDCDFVFMVTGGAQTVLLNYDSSESECKLLAMHYFEKAQICVSS